MIYCKGERAAAQNERTNSLLVELAVPARRLWRHASPRMDAALLTEFKRDLFQVFDRYAAAIIDVFQAGS